MNDIEPGVTDSSNTLFYLKPIDEMKTKKNHNVFMQRRMPKKEMDANLKIQETQMIQN